MPEKAGWNHKTEWQEQVMEKVLDYLGLMKEDKASDLFIMAGTPVCEKCEGRFVYFNGTGRVTSLAEAKKLSPDETEILDRKSVV